MISIFHLDPMIEEKFSDVSVNIIKKYGVCEKEYWDAFEVTFKNDQ